jgi:hypothetical protein
MSYEKTVTFSGEPKAALGNYIYLYAFPELASMAAHWLENNEPLL